MTNVEQGADKIRQMGPTSLTVSGALAWALVNVLLLFVDDIDAGWATGMVTALGIIFKGTWEFVAPFMPKPPSG